MKIDTDKILTAARKTLKKDMMGFELAVTESAVYLIEKLAIQYKARIK